MGNGYGWKKGRPRAAVPRRCWPTFTCYALQRVTGITLSVLLRGAAQPTNHLSRFLSERSADFVDDTTPHNREVFLGPSTRSNEESCCLDGGEKQQQHHRQRRGPFCRRPKFCERSRRGLATRRRKPQKCTREWIRR